MAARSSASMCSFRSRIAARRKSLPRRSRALTTRRERRFDTCPATTPSSRKPFAGPRLCSGNRAIVSREELRSRIRPSRPESPRSAPIHAFTSSTFRTCCGIFPFLTGRRMGMAFFPSFPRGMASSAACRSLRLPTARSFLPFPLRCFGSLTGSSAVLIKSDASGVRSVGVDAIEIPTDGKGRVWVHFSPPNLGRYVSAIDLLQGEDARRQPCRQNGADRNLRRRSARSQGHPDPPGAAWGRASCPASGERPHRSDVEPAELYRRDRARAGDDSESDPDRIRAED